MSIPDKAVEAGGKALFAEEQCDRKQREDLDANWNGRLDEVDQVQYRSLSRAVLEAAEPYLTGGEGWLRTQLEEQVKTWEGLTAGNALNEFDRGATTARLLALRNLRALLAAHPEVKS